MGVASIKGYPGDIEADVSPERLKRFFNKENGGYRIRKEVRDLVVFAPHNLLGDPPFSRIHLISCRNLLIYLDRSVQHDVIDLFHYALCPDGYLLLGSSETVEATELFKTEDKKTCLFRKRNVPVPEPRLPVFPLARLSTGGEIAAQPTYSPRTVPYEVLHQNMLERCVPSGYQLLRTGHFSEAPLRYYLPFMSRIFYPARLVDVLEEAPTKRLQRSTRE